jgi:uncharacterized protein (TIGR00375 family)
MIYADFHIHVGRSLNKKVVKITASPALTLPEIVKVAGTTKGLNMVGIVDSHSLGVRQDYKELLANGVLQPLEGGGYRSSKLVIIPGMETELKIGKGHAHFLAFFPSINHLEDFCKPIQQYVRNWQLSSQKVHLEAKEWILRVEEVGGIWFPAHAFTPHKGIYGSCCDRIQDVLPILPKALEMGLSADRSMARCLSEVDNMLLLSNSDAHSLANIAREYNCLLLEDNSFEGLSKLVKNINGKIIRNYGMNPQMGKYHRSYCPHCSKIFEVEPPVLRCPYCASPKIVLGVLDRLTSIADRKFSLYQKDNFYVYRVPLRFLPGIGPQKYAQLLKKFGTELAVYHDADIEDLISLVGEKIATIIFRAREGSLQFSAGGGGYFGKVSDIVY